MLKVSKNKIRGKKLALFHFGWWVHVYVLWLRLCAYVTGVLNMFSYLRTAETYAYSHQPVTTPCVRRLSSLKSPSCVHDFLKNSSLLVFTHIALWITIPRSNYLRIYLATSYNICKFFLFMILFHLRIKFPFMCSLRSLKKKR